MNSNVYIKSYTHGLRLFLNEDCDFEIMLEELRQKFDSSKEFFKNVKIAISFEGRKLSFEEEMAIIKTIEEVCELKILYIDGKDDATNYSFQKALNRPMYSTDENDCFNNVYYGSIKRGDHLTSQTSIVIVGDVEPGASITAKGSIIVLGGIYGTCIIEDAKDIKKCFISCMDASAERVKIGNYLLLSREKPKWVVKPKMVPKIFYAANHEVVMEPISNQILSKLCERISKE